MHTIWTIGDLLRGAVDQHPDRVAIVFDDQRRTYAQLWRGARRVAAALMAAGTRPGDGVGTFMANGATHVEVLFGTALVGARFVPLNTRYRDVELSQVVPGAGLRVLVASGDGEGSSLAERWHETTIDPGPHHLVVDGPGPEAFAAFEHFLARGHGVDEETVDQRASAVTARSAAIAFHTSGTTAVPKGCVLSHEALVRQAIATADRLDYRDGDVMFSPLPLFHTGGAQLLLAMVHRAATYVNMRHVDGEPAARLVEDTGVTVAFTAFPAITDALLDHCPGDVLRRVRSLFHVAPAEQLRTLQERLGSTVLVNGYGMTEFGGSVVQTSPSAPLADRLTQGTPLPGVELQVRDPDDGRVLPVGEQGEITVRGPTMFDGYLGRDRSDDVDDQGWFRTGDLGRVDEAGRLHFLGRLRDVLKIGGENVGALEIESHLQAHPGVRTAAVVAVPDERLGEVAAAFVEVRPGEELSETGLLDHCRGRIASFKVPRHVRFVSEWPMSATKIRKEELRRQLLDELHTAGH